MDLLLDGARTLGRTVEGHIQRLRGDLDLTEPWLELAIQPPTEEEAQPLPAERVEHGSTQNRSVTSARGAET